MSARVFAAAGFEALATSSASVAWSLGRADGENISRSEMVAAIRRVVAVSEVPVTADIESGYGSTPAEVGETIRLVLAVGAVGVNLEDGTPDGSEPLRPIAENSARLRAARAAADEAGVPLFINGRTDVYLLGVGEPEGRFAMAVERAHEMLAAGADGIFVPAVKDAETIARLAAAIPAPLNVMVLHGMPPVAELAKAGVRRLSTGGRPAQAVLGLLSKIAAELRQKGTYELIFDHALPSAEIQRLFSERRQ
jgi:2-methylisocitrate lyase-like PEP mutase family enzyme